DQEKLVAEFEGLVNLLLTGLLPELERQFPAEFAKNPSDPQMEEIEDQLLQYTYSNNRYTDAQEIADVTLSHLPEHMLAANIAGMARFANHQFEDAVKVLEQAQTKDLLIPELGGHHLEAARKYVDYWKTEQEVRAKEAAGEPLPQVVLKTPRGDVTVELFENE